MRLPYGKRTGLNSVDRVYMIEPKARNEMNDPVVLAKRASAVKWCGQASDHAKTHSGKRWKYLLIPHDMVTENVTLEWLAIQFGGK